MARRLQSAPGMSTLSRFGTFFGLCSLLSACGAPPRATEPELRPVVLTRARQPEPPPELPPLELDFRPPAPVAAPEEDPSGEALAMIIAARVLDGAAAEDGPGLPAPRSESDNNPFALVRPAEEMAEEGPLFVMSPDEKRFVFVRPEGGTFPELWIADVDGSSALRLVDLRTSVGVFADGESNEIPSESLFAPAFSADGRRVYFQTDGWATSLALYSVSAKGEDLRFVSDANGYFVIEKCQKRSLVGSLIAYRHSYSELPLSAVDWYFLLDPSGKKLGVVGDAPENVDRFLEKTCGLGRAPARLKSLPGCDGEVLRYEPKRFLDGTVLELLYWVSIANSRRPLKGDGSDGEWLGAPLGPAEAEASLAERCEK